MTFTPTVLTNAYISINSNVISDHANKVEIPVEVEDKKTTTFGQTYETLVGGLASGTLKISLYNDFSASNLDAIFWPLLRQVVAFEIRPDAGTVTSANPKYTGNILINGWTPISGAVGDVAQVDVSFPTSGTVTRATS